MIYEATIRFAVRDAEEEYYPRTPEQAQRILERGLQLGSEAQDESMTAIHRPTVVGIKSIEDKPGLVKAIKRFIKFQMECKPEFIDQHYGYAKGDEEQPFMSESFLYTLIGKMDARTIRGRMDDICKEAGVEFWELEQECYRELDAEKKKNGRGKRG